MKKSQQAKTLIKIYKSKKYFSFRNQEKFNKLEDLAEFYVGIKLSYDLLSEMPAKYLISVIQDYVLIRNSRTKFGDTYVIDAFDDVFKACYLLDDLLFTMRIGGFKTFYSNIFCYFISDTEHLLKEINELRYLECFQRINGISGISKLKRKDILDRLNKDLPAIDILKLSITKQDKIFDLTKEMLKLTENAKKSLLKYVIININNNKSFN
ncbi:MAG: hypothetical protein KAH13_05295 [Tenericutes bacterium]|nr:hypothetical protein [Mycoplasmatota bacterium]